MTTEFVLFGAGHLTALILTAGTALALSVVVRARPAQGPHVRRALAAVLIVNALTTYVQRLASGVLPPEGLPLHLSDAVVVVAVVALLSTTRWSVELSYYWGITSSFFALLTPDLHDAFPSARAVQFFVSHGGVMVAATVLVWGERRWMQKASHWRAVAWINAYALAVGLFNWIFETNYLYLRHKPARDTLLDYMGPWPVYVLLGDLLALLLFRLLSLPFAKGPKQTEPT